MKRRRIPSRVEKLADKKAVIEHRQKGTGHYVFRNKSDSATLLLAKPALNGSKHVAAGAEFEGDSYFMSLVPREAVLVKIVSVPEKNVREQVEVETAEVKTEETMPKEKLLLDQPDQVTDQGKVEQVANTDDTVKPLHETPQPEGDKEVLLTEDPLDGVKIIIND